MTNDHTLPVCIEQAMPLAEMSVTQISALTQAQLQEAHTHLINLQSMVKAVLDRIHTALEQRYAEPAKAARLDSGRDFGVCHINDGALRVTVDLPKKVSWDQALLSASAARIVAAGESVATYIDTDYSIPEGRFNNWPAVLKEHFAQARTVKPGKPSYRLTLIDSEGGV